MFLKSFNKFQITLICLSILTIVSLGLFNLSNINSYAESKENPESLVSLELNSNVTLSELNTNLRASVGNIDNLSINSISTKINIGESEQTFTKNNFSTDGQIKNDELSSSKILKQFPKSLKAFSKTLLIMKDKFDSNQESQISESDTISPLMTKYSKDTLNKIDIKTKKLNSNGINISSISLMGSNNFITRISVNESIKNISRNINVTNLKEIQRQGDELKLKLDKASSEEAKNLIMQIELAKISGNNNQPNLNITPDQVKAVNKLSFKDITGNIFISNDNIKKLGLSDKQISNIVLAMSNYNKLPEELKDGTQQAIQVIINSSIQKQEELKQAELFDKVAQVLTSTINAHAGVCSNQYNNLGRYWWGMTIRGSQCFGYDVRNTFTISFAFATAVALLCTMAAVFAGAGAIACGIFITAWTTISSKIMLFGYDFAWKAGSCGGWVTANINYWGSYSLYC